MSRHSPALRIRVKLSDVSAFLDQFFEVFAPRGDSDILRKSAAEKDTKIC